MTKKSWGGGAIFFSVSNICSREGNTALKTRRSSETSEYLQGPSMDWWQGRNRTVELEKGNGGKRKSPHRKRGSEQEPSPSFKGYASTSARKRHLSFICCCSDPCANSGLDHLNQLESLNIHHIFYN